MGRKKLLSVLVALLASFFFLASCNPEISAVMGYPTPTVKGRITVPPSSGLLEGDIWLKVVDGTETKYVGKVGSDGTFAVGGLEAAKQYSILFSSKEPDHGNISRDATPKAAGSGGGYGGWLTNVTAAINEGNDVGSVKMKPLGTITGVVKQKGAESHYDATVYIPGSSFIAMTDGDGNFSMFSVPQGTHTIRYTADGYVSVMKEGALLHSESETENPVLTLAEVELVRNVGEVQGIAMLSGAADHAGITVKLEGEATSVEGSTSSNGDFRITGVPPGTYAAVISFPGYLTQTVGDVKVTTANTTTMAEATLVSNGGGITGKVKLNDGAGAEGAIVAARSSDGKFSYTGSTDASGGYSLDNCYPGTYTVTISKTGYASHVESGVVSSAGNTTVLDEIILSSSFGSVSGVVKDSRGNPLAHVQVNIGDFTAFTNSEGDFIKSGLPLGQYTVTVSKDGYTTKALAQKVSIESNKTATIGEQMLASIYGSINGAIALNDGKSPEGATVSAAGADGSNSYPATAASDGTYSISNVLPATYILSVIKEGYAAVSKTISVTADYTTAAGTITLESLYGSLKVLVNYADKDPDDKITVSIRNGESSIRTATTSNSSTLIFNDIPVGTGYVVTASALGYSSSEKTSVSVISNTETTVQLDDLSNRYGSVSGIVQTNAGTSLAGAIVLIKGTSEYTATTDENGSFAKDGIGIGSYEVTISKDGYGTLKLATAVSVESSKVTSIGTQKLTPTTAVISGTVGYADKTDSTGIAMTLVNSSEQPVDSFTTTADGQYTFRNVPPGTYKVRAGATGYSAVEKPIAVVAGQSYTVALDSLTSIYGKITGTVKLQGVADYSAIQVTATGTEVYHVQTTAGGAFTISNVIPGTYALKYEKSGFVTDQSRSATVTAGTVTTVDETTLLSSVGSLKVTASYADKTIDEKITITLFKGETSIASTTTSIGNGTVTFSNLAIGNDYRVVATADGYSSSESNGIIISSGTETPVVLASLGNRFGSVSGTVQASSGSPLSGALVLLQNTANISITYTLTTDTDGVYNQGSIAIGNYNVTISLQGFADEALSQSISVLSSKATNIGITKLTSLYGSLTGSIKLQGATEYSGILITVSGSQTYAASTTSDGSYSVSALLPGTYSVILSKAGFVSKTISDVVITADTNTIVAESTLVSSSCGISGRVVLEGSTGNSGAIISATLVGDSSKTYTATTLEDGTYSFTGLDAGQYSIRMQMTGFVTDNSQLITTAYGEVSLVPTVTLKSVTSTVNGNVTLSGSVDHTGINVLLKAADTSSQYDVTTDRSGAYTITKVQPGVYDLYASKSGFETKTATDITIEPTSTKTIDSLNLAVAIRAITGSVELELRTDHSGALITATKVTDPTKVYSAISNSAGNYTLAGMDPGEYGIVITSAGYRTMTLPTTDVVADSTASLSKTSLLIARGTIAGIATLEGRSSQEGTKVELLGTEYQTLTNALGEYSFNVPQGNYPGGLRFTKEDFKADSHTDTIPVLTDSVYAVPERTIKATHTTVKGIVDVEGTNDDSGVVVSIDGTLFSMVTSADGKFRYDHVPLGNYTLRYQRENAPVVTAEISVTPALEIIAPTTTLLPQQASIHGYATLDGMTNFSGITIEVKNNDTLQVVTATSGADGYFYIPNILTSGTYTVSYSKQGWDTQSMIVTGFTPLENRNLTQGAPIVLLDSTPPQVGNFTINTGSNFTDNKNVSLNIPVTEQGSGTVSMQLRLNSYPISPNWLPYAITVTKDLEEIFAPNYVGNGEYTISVRVKDLAGNVSGWVDDSITLTDQKTIVKGVLTDSQLHWTEEKSPYRVEGNILVGENKTLVIDPGVEVLFGGEYYVLVDGNIWVDGTEQKMVRFLNDFDNSGMWEGLIISAKSPSLVFSDEVLISGNYFNYSYFAQAQRALNAGAVSQQNGLYVENCNFSETNLNSITFNGFVGSHIVLKNNILKSDMQFGINDDYTRILVENNIIQTKTVSLYMNIYSYSSIENVIIENNTFDATQIEFSIGGWAARSGSRFRFVHNIIKDAQDPITIAAINGFDTDSAEMNFSSNNFINCSGFLVNTAGRTYQSRSENVLPYNFTNTFWGNAATEELLSPGFDGNASFIYDFYDDFTIPQVNFGEYRVNP